MIPWLEPHNIFPDVATALGEAEGAPGLLAAGGDLSPARLLIAYQHGIFPWFSDGQPILWWSPDPRMVLFTDQFVPSHSLRKTLRKIDISITSDREWEIRFDSDFEGVIRACAAPRKRAGGTWISEDIVDAYMALHQLGYAHSSELWRHGELVGGAYGMCLGRMFYGESMFARTPDASKIALAYLVHFLKMNGVAMIDCQQQTPHLASLGASPIPRTEFIKRMKNAVDQPAILRWEPLQLFD